MQKLKIAIQKSGRLSEKSLKLLEECGIKTSFGGRKLKAEASNFPAEFLFLRDDDMPQYVEQGIADVAIIGQNEVWEQDKDIKIVKNLGFANCKMSLAIPKDETYSGVAYFDGKRIATSYPNILRDFLDKNNVKATIEQLSGSVEIATGIGLADGIFDIVSTGSTLMMNGLKEVEVVTKSEAVLIASPKIPPKRKEILEDIIFRINAVKEGTDNRYILLNAPEESIDEICALLPGMKSPTILPLAKPGWKGIHSVVKEDQFWRVIDELKKLGAQGILILPIEKMII